jgi:hypothetical protein
VEEGEKAEEEEVVVMVVVAAEEEEASGVEKICLTKREDRVRMMEEEVVAEVINGREAG